MVQRTNKESSARDHFVWLLDSKEFTKKRAQDDAEVKLACQFALENWQLLPIITPRLRTWAGRAYEKSEYFQKLEDLTVAVRTLSTVQMLLCRRFTGELEVKDVPYCLLKGAAARIVAYPVSSNRCGLDVDVAVPRHFLRQAEAVALRLGFLPASLDESRRHFFVVDASERVEVEKQHYELVCLVRRQAIEGLAPAVEDAIRKSIEFLKPWHVTEDGKLACYVTLAGC